MMGNVFANGTTRSTICRFTGLQRFAADRASFEVPSALGFVDLEEVVLEFDDGSRWDFATERHDARTSVHGRIWRANRS